MERECQTHIEHFEITNSTFDGVNQSTNQSKFLPRDARSVKRGIAIVSRPSVRLYVRNVDVPRAYRLN